MLRALIVEDDPASREALVDLVRTVGFGVSTASTLREARRQLRDHAPDLLLTDLGLPDGDGMDLLEEIGGAAGTRVVVVTGDESAARATQALRHGAADYLVKPVQPRRLRNALSKVLRGRSGEGPPTPRRGTGDSGPQAPRDDSAGSVK